MTDSRFRIWHQRDEAGNPLQDSLRGMEALKEKDDQMMNQKTRAFRIAPQDNVATALTVIPKGAFLLFGEGEEVMLEAEEEIPRGHKVAVRFIKKGEAVIKYGVSIGEATEDIRTGQWVHLHCMKSCYDERSSGLDIHTGAAADISYELSENN